MKLGKRLLRSSVVQWVLSTILLAWLRLAYRTMRWKIISHGKLESQLARNKGFIGALWHGRLVIAPFLLPKKYPRKLHAVISLHNDGEFLTRIIEKLGAKTVRGSSSRGGLSALQQSITILEHGGIVGVTPDGPRGPRMHIGGNIIGMAQKARVNILPITFATKKNITFKSWDRFMLPLPFGKGVIIYGNAVEVPEDADKEELLQIKQKLENELNRITREADEMMGLQPIEPASAEEIQKKYKKKKKRQTANA